MDGAPRATYRVQLHAGFGFRDVARIAPYLARLGVTHVYCSPYLQAQPGSTHGYDVVDHTRLNDELGGREGFEEMVAALGSAGLSHIVDIVPNHVSIEGRSNAAWWDVLQHGRAARHASWFDIEWDPPPTPYLKDKVLVPILGDDLDNCVEREEIQLAAEGSGFVVRYYDHELPVAPGSVDPGTDPAEVDLSELLERQHYVLANWRIAARHLNYRRFFDINTLAGLQVDDPDVFEATHRLTLDLVEQGKVDGLRIDHIDGLRDPRSYLEELESQTGGTYVVVEKITEPPEELRTEWPVAGTTGYDFLNLVQGLFVSPAGEGPLTQTYESFSGERDGLDEVTRAKKFLVMRHIMSADLTRLIVALGDAFDVEGWDWDPDELRIVLAEVIAALHVYRTYIAPDGTRSREDERILSDALAEARKRCTHLDPVLFDRLDAVLRYEAGGRQAAAFVLRFQQTTGPIMAKGVEDTVFYNYNRFVALNEVGGDPGRFGTPVEEFHGHAGRAQEQWPLGMLATSTHDTKRSEDVRARLALISEMPSEWADAVERFAKTAERHRSAELPDRNSEYLLYQVLVGAWPLTVDRAVAYMEKASKEAKRHTSWTDPRPDYEHALRSFVEGLLGDDVFTGEMTSFVEPLVRHGRVNSLAQTLVKLTYPGCPDVYQGTELWDLSLVDPDNRRPVDYDERTALLDSLDGAPDDLLAEDGRGKLYITTKALQLRKRLPHAFGAPSSYAPLGATGAKAHHVVAYLRGEEVAVLVPRLVVGLDDDWGDTTVSIPDGSWIDELSGLSFSGGDVAAADLTARCPVALLVKS